MKKKKLELKDLTFIALMTALMCILGPLSIPIGPVPISFTNLVIYLTMYILDAKRGTISYILYLLIGLAGVPVFSGFTSGPAKLLGPTGGYLIGFIFMAFITGLTTDHYFKHKTICIIGMFLGTIVCYCLGTLWLSFSISISFSKALTIGVLPFLIVDFIKIILAAFIGSSLKERLWKSNSYSSI